MTTHDHFCAHDVQKIFIFFTKNWPTIIFIFLDKLVKKLYNFFKLDKIYTITKLIFTSWNKDCTQTETIQMQTILYYFRLF